MIPTKEMKAMRAFHGDPAIKEKYLKRIKAHYDADEIAHGFYWENGKGCAVGCTVEKNQIDYPHKAFETELGIPEAIAHVEDRIFEGLTNGDAKIFPVNFLEAIPVGADLSLVPAKLIAFILRDTLNVKEVKDDKKVYKIVEKVAGMWENVCAGKVPTKTAWSAARSAAWSAAWSAAYKRYADKLIELLKESK